MKRGLTTVLALVLALSLLLSATALAESDKRFAGRKITFTGWGDAAEQEATQNVIDQFEEDTGAEVNYIHIPSEYDTKLTAMIAANEPLDLVMMESGTIAYPLAAQGKFVDLMPLIEADPDIDLEDFVSSGNYYDDEGKLLTFNGSIEIMTCFYNPSLFDAAGLPYPDADPAKAWTWDEFLDVAKKLTKDGNGNTPDDEGFDPDNIVQYGCSWDTWWPFWGSLILSNGGQIVDENGAFAMNQPEAVEAIQQLADLALVHHVMPTPTAKEGLPGSDIAMLTGQYAMVFAGQWTALSLDSAGAAFQMAPLPRMGEQVVAMTTAGMYCIMQDSENQDVAWELFKYINDPRYDITLFKNGNRMPTNHTWLTDSEYLDQWAGKDNTARPAGYEGTIKMLMEYSCPPLTATIRGFSDMITVVDAEMSEVFTGNKTAQEAMDAAAQKIEQAGYQLGIRSF